MASEQPPPPLPSLSVIVPTHNGARKVPRLLDSLNAQPDHDIEVIVVIDGSTDNTAELLRARRDAFRLRIIEQENRGRAGSRNRGAREAHAPLLLFLDDDMRVEPDTLPGHRRHHKQYPGSILVGAQVFDPAQVRTDMDRYKAYCEQLWQQHQPASFYQQAPEQPYITAAHFSLRNGQFFQLGGFDEQLSDTEDYDLAMRAAQAGLPLYTDPQLIAWHDDFVTAERYIQRRRQYYTANRMLAERKPQLIKQFQRNLQPWRRRLPFYKRWAFSLMARPDWVRQIDREAGPLRWLPRRLRYRCYDLVIYGLSLHYPHRKL
jgi:GT2 family glycosyltransferase